MSSAFLSLLFLVCSIVLCNGFTFTGNLSKSDIQSHGWKFKSTSGKALKSGMLIGGTFLAGDFTGNKHENLEFTAGSGYVALGGYPMSYLAAYNGSFSAPPVANGADFDVVGSVGYMAHACLFLEERDPNNTRVAATGLQWRLPISGQGFSYSLMDNSKGNDDIQFVTFAGDSNAAENNLTVEITYMAASQAGVVTGDGIDDIPMVPGSIESIVSINNYAYKNSTNTLSLVMAVATGFQTVAASGQTVYSKDKSVYFSMSKSAFVSGKKVAAVISAFEAGDFEAINNTNFYAQIQAKYGNTATVQLVKVSFPAGATNIKYDPTIGTGIPVAETESASTTSGSSASGIASFGLIVMVTLLVSMLM